MRRLDAAKPSENIVETQALARRVRLDALRMLSFVYLAIAIGYNTSVFMHNSTIIGFILFVCTLFILSNSQNIISPPASE